MDLKEDSFACVILNYNDAETTVGLIDNIEDFTYIDAIIVVDNNSTDDSMSVLNRKKYNKKVHIVLLDSNRGYGSGNNKGIDFARDLGYRYVIISNPDVIFEDIVLEKILKIFKRNADYAVLSPVQLDICGKVIRDYAWKLPTINEFIFTSGLIMWKLINGYHYEPEIDESKKLMEVDCVPGAFLCIDTCRFKENYYDEEFFLYCEEMVIATVVKRNGYKTALLCDEIYRHMHSVSINKSIRSVRKQREILTKSRLLFLKKYLGANSIQMILARLFFGISDIEAVINENIKRRKL